MEMPLAGIRVLDLSTMYPGPVCTMTLADFGAEVIRVEPTKGGDLWRYSLPLVNGLGMPYLQVNRNKKSICLNLKDPKAKEMSGKRCIRIVFTENSSFEPVIANMVLECKAPVNILLADTKDIGGIAHGQMILQLPEDELAANKMIHYLQERKLEVEELKDYVG